MKRMMFRMDPLTKIQQMYLQFCWSVKLNVYLDDNRMKGKSEFDVQLLYAKDEAFFPKDQFESIEDIVIASENNIVLNLGCYFIALNQAFEKSFGKVDMKRIGNQPYDALRALIYMCRCAFAHDILQPHWNVKKDFRKMLAVNFDRVSINIDFSNYDKRKFDINDIGGYKSIIQIHKSAEKLLASSNLET